jgi:hypothetical protein
LVAKGEFISNLSITNVGFKVQLEIDGSLNANLKLSSITCIKGNIRSVEAKIDDSSRFSTKGEVCFDYTIDFLGSANDVNHYGNILGRTTKNGSGRIIIN